ncbi:hydroxyisourate hydrolase [Streptomyces sp. NPDC047000]|uniref:hydroxyisourate hydrolase n=1 Tax=Streptomyces sp. NPDC047000 TaxID=3155474 RepID=UPI0034054714
MSTAPTGVTVSTHVLDTSVGRPAAGVPVRLSVRPSVRGTDPSPGGWRPLGGSVTDEDGRCRDLPAPPPGTAHVRLEFAVEPYLEATAAAHHDSPASAAVPAPFFPEVTVTFAVRAGEHHHVPLLLSPFGYSVYRGS